MADMFNSATNGLAENGMAATNGDVTANGVTTNGVLPKKKPAAVVARRPYHYHVGRWVAENKDHFPPPVCNALMHGGQLKVMFVGGPNSRADYHIEEGEEMFMQLQGDMILGVEERGRLRQVRIHQGEVFLLPARVPHSPQRLSNTVGVVFERHRLPDEEDAMRYYENEQTGPEEGSIEAPGLLWEKWFYCGNLVTDLPVVISEYRASSQFKTKKPVEGFVQPPPYPLDKQVELMAPLNLKLWIAEHEEEIHKHGFKRVFPEHLQTQMFVFGEGSNEGGGESYDTFIWQQKGCANVKVEDEEQLLDEDGSFLVPAGKKYMSKREGNSLTLVLFMCPDLKKF